MKTRTMRQYSLQTGHPYGSVRELCRRYKLGTLVDGKRYLSEEDQVFLTAIRRK